MIERVPSSSLTALAAAVLHVDPDPERILEIGCGEGDGVLFLAREFPRARVRGVDSDASAIRSATARIGLDPEGRVAFKQGRRRSLPYPDSFFDLVVQRRDAAPPAETARVLRPGGRLVYVATRQRWLPPALQSALSHRRLRRIGLDVVRSGEIAGLSFYVGRLSGP